MSDQPETLDEIVFKIFTHLHKNLMNKQNLIKFSVSDDLAKSGIKVTMAVISVTQVSKRRGSELEKKIKDTIQVIDVNLLLSSKVLEAYQEYYKNVGIEGMTPAEHLLKLVERSKMLPNINKVVDCYNLVSLETLLSIGAHDLAHIKGNIEFRYTDGTEKYTPLGKSEPEKVVKGEYACIDEEKILCRMDIKQCDETKVCFETREFIVYVQGNKETSQEYIQEVLLKVCENIKNYCEGSYEIL